MTHRQLTHWQKEKRLQRIVAIAGIVVIVAILALVGVGFYMAKFKPMHQTVLKIGNTEYNMDYMIDTLAAMGIKNADATYQSMYASYAVQTIEQNYFLVQAAATGYDNITPVTVSDAEVMKYIADNNLSKDKTRQDAVRRQLVTDKLKSDVFSPQVPATAEHRSVWAMLLESQAQADQVKARLDKGEKFADITAELSLNGVTKDKKGDLGWLPYGILSSVLTNIGDNSTTLLENKIFDSTTTNGTFTLYDADLDKNIGYWLIKRTDTNDDNTRAHIYAMLLGSRQQADQVKTELSAGGNGHDWATLAKAYSLYDNATGNGGDLGLKAKGDLGDAVDAVVFDADGNVILDADNVTAPLADASQTTKGAMWLVQINGIENQTISDANRTTFIADKLNAWFIEYYTANKDNVTNLLDPDLQQYAINQAVKR